MKFKSILIGALILAFGGLAAQEPLLTKEEAIEQALEQNFNILVARNDVKIASNNKNILNTGYLPSLTGLSGANYNRDDSTIEFPGQVDEDGNPRPDLTIDKAESQRYNAGLNLDYTLFDGLGRLYNYRILKEQYNLSELQARQTIELTIVELMSVYYEIARLTENENVQQEALEISKDRIKRLQYAFEYGQATKLDILNAEVDLTNDSINLLNTQQLLNNAKRDLNVVLNRDLTHVFEVDTTVRFLPELEIDVILESASENNVTVLQTESNLAINDYDIKVSKSGYLPRIGLLGSYGWNLNQSAASAFFPGVNNETFSLGAGASLTWNLFDGGTTITRVKNSKIAYKNQELLKNQVLLEVDRDILNALETYENRLEIFKIQEQAVITNESNFARSREQFQLGRITSIQFRQAQIDLLNARTVKNLAKYDAKLAEIQLLQLAGQILNVTL